MSQSITDIAYARLARVDPPRDEAKDPLIQVTIRSIPINHVILGQVLSAHRATKVRVSASIEAHELVIEVHQSDLAEIEGQLDPILSNPKELERIETRLADDLRDWTEGRNGSEKREAAEFPGSWAQVYRHLHKGSPKPFVLVKVLKKA